MEQYVITHSDHGIYVGSALGLGFWSNMSAAGQNTVPTFDTETDAREHVESWSDDNIPDDYGYAPVEVDDDTTFATISQLRAAGLEEMLGELIVNTPTIPSPYGYN